MAQTIASFSPWRRRRTASTPITPLDQALAESIEPEEASQNGNNNNDPSLSPRPTVSLLAGTSTRHLSSSVTSGGFREPIRSFIHGSVREHIAPVDSVHNARTVREDTAELASFALAGSASQRSVSFLQRARPSIENVLRGSVDAASAKPMQLPSEAIAEASEPSSAGTLEAEDGPSTLANLLRRSPPETPSDPHPDPLAHLSQENGILDQTGHVEVEGGRKDHRNTWQQSTSHSADHPASTEQTPLLGKSTSEGGGNNQADLEGQHSPAKGNWLTRVVDRGKLVEHQVGHAFLLAAQPQKWNYRSIWQSTVVAPASCLPAVCVGLLLNILDALSYGMILFPLGKPIFSHLGSAGISIFYVSTIVSQLTFSSGSIFRGAVGSELIEVVPFFHNMAQKITEAVGSDQPDAVIATTIVSYAISSMMTGLVFWLMGRFKFGYMVGFIPRHILIGCIGGVGWFLVATGFEVSARLDGSLNYDLDTFHKLTQADTVPLWVFPLVLAIALFWGQNKVPSKYFLPLYILGIPVIFYLFVTSIDVLDIDNLRDHGWIFEGPPSGEPWWYFYTLYKFHLVRWDAVLETIPAMLALTFFGILHVPINVPALALNCGEDNADLDKELRLHGYSNFLSGCFGSIQNYLVYANTVFFMRSGGDTRLAGFMLAALTFCVMLVGPTVIGFIPVMMVGTLIFDLGFELLLEAVWLPRKKLKLPEFLTVVAIVLVMGIYDFVVGIGVGVLLAFITLIVQTSRVSPIRGTYGGNVVNSTVRRNPSQHHYLGQVGKQIYIMKLTGYLFFGTIVSVEEKIRALVDDQAFAQNPIKFLVLDLWYVTGLDYSAGEAFNTVSRLLFTKGVVLVLSGVGPDSQLGRNLQAVGLGSGETEVMMLPDLNSALESCENELLKTLYARQEAMDHVDKGTATASLDVPAGPKTSTYSSFDAPLNSPRRNHLVEAAQEALTSTRTQPPTRWQTFREPLRLMLQIFQGLSDKNEDMWFSATKYFKRRECPAGAVLFRRGEEAEGFYMVESGILRAEYDLPQGWFCESIVAGTTCGELPFFSETDRTATVVIERDCVVWLLDLDGWRRLQEEEPDVARELLRISLKLTSERMSAITSYVLAMAG